MREWTFPLIRERMCMLPVSYTHLDVYKRQVVGFETFDKAPLVIARLHERGFRVIKISIVPGTFVECVRNVLFAHLLSHFGNKMCIRDSFKALYI